MGADRTVREEIAARPDRSQAYGGGDIRFTPVRRHEHPVITGQQPGDVGLAGDVRARHLMHRGDAGCGETIQGDALQPTALRRGHGIQDHPPGPVVGIGAQRSGGVEAGESRHVGDPLEQRRRRQCRVDVDPRQVDRAAPGGAIDVCA